MSTATARDVLMAGDNEGQVYVEVKQELNGEEELYSNFGTESENVMIKEEDPLDVKYQEQEQDLSGVAEDVEGLDHSAETESYCGEDDENMSDDMDMTTIANAEPVPVILSADSINSILESQDITDANPLFAECLGNAALKQLRHLVKVASEVAYFNKASGIRLSDFIFAENKVNNLTNEAIRNASVFEEPPYEMTFNGLLLPSQGEAFDPAIDVRRRKECVQQLKELEDPQDDDPLTVQKIAFHEYQHNVESSEDSDEENASDSNENDSDLGVRQNSEGTKLDSNGDGDSEDTFEGTSSDSDSDDEDCSTCSELSGLTNGNYQDSQNSQSEDGLGSPDQKLHCETKKRDKDPECNQSLDKESESEELKKKEDGVQQNKHKINGEADDQLDPTQASASPNASAETTEIEEDSAYIQERLLEGSTAEESSSISGEETEVEEEVFETSGESVDDKVDIQENSSKLVNGEEPANEIDHTTKENVPEIETTEKSEATPEQWSTNEACVTVNGDALIDDTKKSECIEDTDKRSNEVDDEQYESNDMEDLERSDSESLVSDRESSACSTCSFSEEDDDTTESSDEEDENKLTFSKDWVDYMKVLVEEFIALEDDPVSQNCQAKQLSRLRVTNDPVTSEFSVFVEDIAKHGLLPVVSVWCDFCRDFLSSKICTTVHLSQLRGMLNLFEAMLKSRTSECITPKQMNQIFFVLIEMAYISPPWEIHKNLAHILGLVLKKATGDTFLETISWICSFVTETLDWFATVTCCLEDWDQKCRIFNIALLLVNELEQIGCHFMYDLKWHSYIANVIRALDAINNLRQLSTDEKLDLDSNGKLVLPLESNPVNPTAANGVIAAKDQRRNSAVSSTSQVQNSNTPVLVLGQVPDSENFALKVENCKKIIHKTLNSVGNSALSKIWRTKLREILEFRTEAKPMSIPPENEVQATSTQPPATPVKTENIDADNTPISDTTKTMYKILDSIQDKKIADSLRMKVQESLTGITFKSEKTESESNYEVKMEEGEGTESSSIDSGIHLSIFDSDFIHCDLENGLLLFYKTFARNYSAIVPAPVLVQAQKLASSYFGDRVNIFARSSEVLSCTNVKKRKRSDSAGDAECIRTDSIKKNRREMRSI